MMVLFSVAWAQDPCSLVDLQEALVRTEESFIVADVRRFRARHAAVMATMECLDSPVTRPISARVHRAQALAAFLDRDTSRAQAALAAMHDANPALTWSVELLPEGHQLRLWEDQAAAVVGRDQARLPRPEVGWFTVDGVRTADGPTERPFVMQWHLARRRIHATTYVPAGGVVPALPKPEAALARRTTRRRRVEQVGVVGLVVGGVALAGTIPLSGAAERAWRNEAWDRGNALYQVNAAAGVTGWTLLGVGGSLVVSARFIL